jgi:sulfotransferase
MKPLRLHFISGLPRAGSTMLAAILRQNPRFRSSMSGPLFQIFAALRRSMGYDLAYMITDDQRERVFRGVVEAFYGGSPDAAVIFDTNRAWCSALPTLARVFPESRVICCLRNTAWILDSFERLVQVNSMRVPRIFPVEASGIGHENSGATVVERVELLMKYQVGGCLNGLRQAWFGEYAERLIGIRYESIVEQPDEIIRRLYELLAEDHFRHDFNTLEYDEPAYDEQLGLPGLHRVRHRVEATKRLTILPPDLFAQHNRAFWDMPGQNPRGVTLL